LEISIEQHTKNLELQNDLYTKGQNDLQKARKDNQKWRLDIERANADNKKLREIIAEMQGKVVVVQEKEIEPFKNLIASEAEKMRRLLNPTDVPALVQSDQKIQVSEKRTYNLVVEEEVRKGKRQKRDNQ